MLTGLLIPIQRSARLGLTPLFLAGDAVYSVDDVVASRLIRGDLAESVSAVYRTIRARAFVETEGLSIDEAELQARSEKFRYEHDLISASETEDWLSSRGMDLDDFAIWFEGMECARLVGEIPKEWGMELVEDMKDELPDLLRIELWLSGRMKDLEKEMQRRVVAKMELEESGEVPDVGESRRKLMERQGIGEENIHEWLEAIGRDEEWLEDALRSEAAYELLCSRATTKDARMRRMSELRMPLTRIVLETIELESEAIARELLLCAQDDDVSLAVEAAAAGFCVRREEIWMDAIGETEAQRLFCAKEGAVLGPRPVEGGVQLYQVVKKVLPSLDDPETVSRIDARIVDELFSEMCSRRIQSSEAHASSGT